MTWSWNDSEGVNNVVILCRVSWKSFCPVVGLAIATLVSRSFEKKYLPEFTLRFVANRMECFAGIPVRFERLTHLPEVVALVAPFFDGGFGDSLFAEGIVAGRPVVFCLVIRDGGASGGVRGRSHHPRPRQSYESYPSGTRLTTPILKQAHNLPEKQLGQFDAVVILQRELTERDCLQFKCLFPTVFVFLPFHLLLALSQPINESLYVLPVNHTIQLA